MPRWKDGISFQQYLWVVHITKLIVAVAACYDNLQHIDNTKHLGGNHSSRANPNKNPDRVEGDHCDDRDDHVDI